MHVFASPSPVNWMVMDGGSTPTPISGIHHGTRGTPGSGRQTAGHLLRQRSAVGTFRGAVAQTCAKTRPITTGQRQGVAGGRVEMRQEQLENHMEPLRLSVVPGAEAKASKK